jgi:hypothetical protein
VFEAGQVLDRVQKMGDLFAPVITLKQKLPKLAGIAETVASGVEAGLELAAQAENTKQAGKSTRPVHRRSAPKKKGRKV